MTLAAADVADYGHAVRVSVVGAVGVSANAIVDTALAACEVTEPSDVALVHWNGSHAIVTVWR